MEDRCLLPQHWPEEARRKDRDELEQSRGQPGQGTLQAPGIPEGSQPNASYIKLYFGVEDKYSTPRIT